MYYVRMNPIQKKGELSPDQAEVFLNVLKARFEQNMSRHKGVDWVKVEEKLRANAEKLWSLYEMERTGGEPDLVVFGEAKGELVFYDCCKESPTGRRSLCYDPQALDSRKENKPKDSVLGMAMAMGVELLTEAQYRELQTFGPFDMKTSSWIDTPPELRALGGALFCDYRYGKVFVYHNGAESYYAARGFRARLKI